MAGSTLSPTQRLFCSSLSFEQLGIFYQKMMIVSTRKAFPYPIHYIHGNGRISIFEFEFRGTILASVVVLLQPYCLLLICPQLLPKTGRAASHLV